MELELGTRVALHGAHTAYVDHSPTTSWPGAACRRATHISLVLHRARVAGAVLLRRVFAPGLRRCRKSCSFKTLAQTLDSVDTKVSSHLSCHGTVPVGESREGLGAPPRNLRERALWSPAVDSTGAMDGPIDFPQTVEVFSHSLTLKEKVKGQSPTAPELVVLFFHLSQIRPILVPAHVRGVRGVTSR
jgi:hypothetical protein